MKEKELVTKSNLLNYTPKPLNNQAFTISISTQGAINKIQAGYLTEFESIQMDLSDEEHQRQIFSAYNYSFNY